MSLMYYGDPGGSKCPWRTMVSLVEPIVPVGCLCSWWIQVSPEDYCVTGESWYPWETPVSQENSGVPYGPWCPWWIQVFLEDPCVSDGLQCF